MSCLIALFTAGVPKSSTADEVRAWIGGNQGGSAVTMGGKTIVAERGHRPPWQDDCVRAAAPEYSTAERRQRHEGRGVFHLSLDRSTGGVTKVEVVKSTGFSGLDQSAIQAFRKWRWKPGKWKEIEIPFTFFIAKPLPSIPTGATTVPFSRQ